MTLGGQPAQVYYMNKDGLDISGIFSYSNGGYCGLQRCSADFVGLAFLLNGDLSRSTLAVCAICSLRDYCQRYFIAFLLVVIFKTVDCGYAA